jgi:hypothetical protein
MSKYKHKVAASPIMGQSGKKVNHAGSLQVVESEEELLNRLVREGHVWDTKENWMRKFAYFFDR